MKKIADDRHAAPLQRAVLCANVAEENREVKECLRWMRMPAVSSVEYGPVKDARGEPRRTSALVAQHDHVAPQRAERLHRVNKRFTLPYG